MICFCWEGFPQYAARCVGAVVRATDEAVVVVATRPKVPVEGMERVANCRVVWIEEDESQSLVDLVGEMPRRLLVSGWRLPVFNRFRDHARAHGAHITCLLDNILDNSGLTSFITNFLKSIRFRFSLRSKYDSFLVPGKASEKLLRFYGVDKAKIRHGLYTADDSLFTPGPVITSRPKKIIYVGQLIARKNVLALCRAFRAAHGPEKGWSLDLYGSGPLKDQLIQENADERAIAIHDFLQPEDLAPKYRQARVFCLPSLEEHWGLVVHEAALSGCALLLSKGVGAAADLLDGNGLDFDPSSLTSITAAFIQMFSADDPSMLSMQSRSLALAATRSLSSFSSAI